MFESRKDLLFMIFGAVFSAILANLGGKVIIDFPERPYLGILTVFLAYLSFYFFSYSLQIKTNQDKLILVEKEIEKIRAQGELDRELLNTLRDAFLIRK